MSSFLRRPWARHLRQFRPLNSFAATGVRRTRTPLVFEPLEVRSMMHAGHDGDYALTEHVHQHLTILIDGQHITIPANIGVNSGGVIGSPHTHAADGVLHVHAVGSTPPTEYATLGDFFDVWRTNAGLAGNNPNAVFSQNQLLGNTVDANHVIRMLVNGEVNTDYADYVLNDSDQIVVSYEQVRGAGEPLLNPIGHLNMPAGSTLQVPLTATDPDGDPLTYQVATSDPLVTAAVVTGGRTLKLEVTGKDEHNQTFTGVITLRLFEDLAPETTARIIALVQSGFYDGLKFHRVIDGFMAQGGDPLGTGSGGSGVKFDDEFHPSLSFNGFGQLAMAKSSDDTNDSQFFITDSNLSFHHGTDGSSSQSPPQHLNFNHSIFGQLTSGWETFNNIMKTPVTGESPNANVVITRATIIDDNQNGVVRITAPRSYRGHVNVSVTVDDGDGHTQLRQFGMEVIAPSANSNPFLGAFDDTVQTTTTQPVTIPLEAFDIDGDNIEFGFFFDGPGGDTGATVPRVNVSFSPQSGTPTNNKLTSTLTITPQNGFAGSTKLFIFVFKPGTSPSQSTADVQQIDLLVQPAAPTSIDLAAVSDSGASDSDNLTNRNNANTKTLVFNVAGLQNGATVTVYADGASIGTGSVSSGTATIVTNNTLTLTDGPHTFTAKQNVSGVDSDASPSLVVTIDRTAPQISSSPNTTGSAGQSYSYDAQSPEEGGDGVLYSLISNPVGMSINATSGLVTWASPTVGSHAVTVRLVDKAGNQTDQTFNVQVEPPAPTTVDLQSISDSGESNTDNLTNRNNTGGKTLAFTIGGVQNGATVTLFADGVAIGTGTGSSGSATVVTNNTLALSNGEHTFTARQTIGGAQSLPSSALVVTIDATGPQITTTPVASIPAGQAYLYNAESPEEGGDGIKYSLVTKPSGMQINETSGEVTWASPVVGTHPVVIRLVDKAGDFFEQSFSLRVEAGPQLSAIADRQTDEGVELTFVVTATDANLPQETLVYSLEGTVPAGASINASTGRFTWRPTEAQGGTTYDFTVKVVDSTNLSHTGDFSVEVRKANSAPVLAAIDNQTVVEGQLLQFAASATDTDVPLQTLTYSLGSGAPQGAHIDPLTGQFTWTPTHQQAQATYPISVQVTDSAGSTVSKPVQVSVLAMNVAPVITSVVDQNATTGSQLRFHVAATDANQPLETLTWRLTSGAPDGATINPHTGEFSWTPTAGQGPGDFEVKVKVTDSRGLEAADTFFIHVARFVPPVIVPPIVVPSPSSPGGVTPEIAFGVTVAPLSREFGVLPIVPVVPFTQPAGVELGAFTVPPLTLLPPIVAQNSMLDATGSVGDRRDNVGGGDDASTDDRIDSNVKPASGEEDEPPAPRSSRSKDNEPQSKSDEHPAPDEFSAIDPETLDQAIAELLQEAGG